MHSFDLLFMRRALALAQSHAGNTGKNPSVGCLLVKDGIIIARGATAFAGRPHAETIALEHAGKNAKGATAYITLEPCAHEGETPSCAKELGKAGITRAIIGMKDPDPRTPRSGH